MAIPRRINGISSDTMKLLRAGEGQRADFKRTPDAISADDLVAFANSDVGGSILAGVDERAGLGGVQTGHVVGCDVSDGSILQVTNKALSCLPPVAIIVSTENLAKVPFLRIDIPASSTKPHCTPKGLYCRRDGVRNRPLHPSELLRIFLESEARVFAERFEAAADRITEELSLLEGSLDGSISEMGRKLGWTGSRLNNTESTLSSIETAVQRLDMEAGDLTKRIRAMFRQDKRQDPIYDRERKKLFDQVVDQLQKDKKLFATLRSGTRVGVNASGKTAEELSPDDLKALLNEAIEVVGKLERAKYSIEVKKPAEFSSVEITAIAKLVIEGDEVIDGIEQRLLTADLLGSIRYEMKIVGTGALKKPATTYSKRVFDKAKASVPLTDYPLELGWIFLQQEHRSMGQMQLLVRMLVEMGGEAGLFATARASNEKMQRILVKQDFVRHGESYPSNRKVGEKIALFIRPANN
ncbi:MAG: ATP-binding protein [Alphaproteobacteria bacterium]|nr:ATP-binding protein [Alphaproteobacteria bacterium]